jgi:hypothetical protein
VTATVTVQRCTRIDRYTGRLVQWHGAGVVTVETDDGNRVTGRLEPEGARWVR